MTSKPTIAQMKKLDQLRELYEKTKDPITKKIVYEQYQTLYEKVYGLPPKSDEGDRDDKGDEKGPSDGIPDKGRGDGGGQDKAEGQKVPQDGPKKKDRKDQGEGEGDQEEDEDQDESDEGEDQDEDEGKDQKQNPKPKPQPQPEPPRPPELPPKQTLVDKLVKMCKVRAPILMVGPAGCGKTRAARECADVMGLKFHYQGCCLFSHEVLGFMDAQARLHDTPTTLACKNGGILMYDEIDGSAPEVLLAINGMLANGMITLADGTTLDCHPDMYVICAANTYGRGVTSGYSARSVLDVATLDRFLVIDVDYDEDVEDELSGSKPLADQWRTCRDSVHKAGIEGTVLTYRSMMYYVRLRENDIGVADALQMCWVRGLDTEDLKSVLQNWAGSRSGEIYNGLQDIMQRRSK